MTMTSKRRLRGLLLSLLAPCLIPSVYAFGPDFGEDFISFDTNGDNRRDLRAVFSRETSPEGSFIQARVTDYDDVDDNCINIKDQTYAVVPVGNGLFERRVEQFFITVTAVEGSPGVFSVTTESVLYITPVGRNDKPLPIPGASTTVTPPATEIVAEDDLDLPPSTEFFPLNEELQDGVGPSKP